MSPELAALLEELRQVAQTVYAEVEDAASSVWCWTGCTEHVEMARALVETPDQIAHAYELAIARGDPDAAEQAAYVVSLAAAQAERLSGWASDQSLRQLLDVLRRLPSAFRVVVGGGALGGGMVALGLGLLVLAVTGR